MGTAEILPRTVVTKHGKEIHVKGANKHEIQEVEEMVKLCARYGDGFNLDEFCPKNGHFLHKFIIDPKVLVATDHHGSIKGAAICGFSAVPRVPGAVYAAYFIVKEQERRKGAGSALLNAVYEICKLDNCDTLLFDVYLNNSVAEAWLKKNGFVVTGSLPHCGYVANNGYTDTLLMHKNLSKLSASDVISKI